MLRCFSMFVVALLAFLAVGNSADAQELELREGDHITLIGNVLAERMQHDGWLETLFQARFPEKKLSFRNLGFSGDEINQRQRSANFGSPDEWLARRKTDVVFAFFGSELFRASPRQSDLMIVSGRVSQKMAPVLRQLYDQMPEPKWVIAMGDCASCGGVFNNYAILQGVDRVVPVDVYVPGCPPRPEALIDGIMKLQERIEKEQLA